MKDQDVTKVEFLLMCNDNIVVQRFFNVKGLNKNAHKSVEFYDYFRLFTDKLKNNLKMRSVIYMLDNQYEIGVNPDMLNTSITDGPENFNVYVKIGDMTTGSEISGLIKILVSDMKLIDIIQTLSHEWTHEFARQRKIKLQGSNTESQDDFENNEGGIMTRMFEKSHPEYESLFYN